MKINILIYQLRSNGSRKEWTFLSFQAFYVPDLFHLNHTKFMQSVEIVRAWTVR